MAFTLAAPASRGNALAQLTEALRRAGRETAALDARLLMEEGLGLSFIDILTHPDAVLSDEARALLAVLARRRLDGEPVGRILGFREFWGLRFTLSPATLEPRPDTETLVSVGLAHLRNAKNSAPRILDLGTGTGCILVALLSEVPDALGVGIDRSFAAIQAARHNAWLNSVGDRAGWFVGDWTSALAGRFDLIVSNPPYIPAAGIAGLAQEVRMHDPLAALDGGEDGLSPYRALVPELPRLLKPAGLAAFEVGIGQAEEVAAMMMRAGLAPGETTKDLGGVARVVSARL